MLIETKQEKQKKKRRRINERGVGRKRENQALGAATHTQKRKQP